MVGDLEVPVYRDVCPMRKQRTGRILEIGLPREIRLRKPVRALRLLLILLIPLLVVMVMRDPGGMIHLIWLVLTAGARMLNDTAALLDSVLSGHAH
jgi:hypothetical protein